MKRVVLGILTLLTAATSTVYAANQAQSKVKKAQTCVCASFSPNASGGIKTVILQDGVKISSDDSAGTSNQIFTAQNATDLLNTVGADTSNQNNQSVAEQLVGLGTNEALKVAGNAAKTGILSVAPGLEPVMPALEEIAGQITSKIKPKDVINIAHAAVKSGAKAPNEIKHAVQSAANVVKKMKGPGKAAKTISHALGKLHVRF